MRLEVNKGLESASTIAKAAAKDANALSITTEVIVGAAIPTLLERSASARMIVVGTRGNGEYFAELLGSVSAAVSERAECPVAIISGIPQTGEREGPVVLGVDGSSASSRAVGVAFEEASLGRRTHLGRGHWIVEDPLRQRQRCNVLRTGSSGMGRHVGKSRRMAGAVPGRARRSSSGAWQCREQDSRTLQKCADRRRRIQRKRRFQRPVVGIDQPVAVASCRMPVDHREGTEARMRRPATAIDDRN